MKRVLFVCLGNICRSPAAEGALRARAAEAGLPVEIDSAGTGAWHEGDPPDPRMTNAAARRGYDLTRLRARKVSDADFFEFDLILAMDLANHTDLLEMAPPNRLADIRLFLDFADTDIRETPDPYYGGDQGFETVLDLVEAGVDGVIGYLEDASE